MSSSRAPGESSPPASSQIEQVQTPEQRTRHTDDDNDIYRTPPPYVNTTIPQAPRVPFIQYMGSPNNYLHPRRPRDSRPPYEEIANHSPPRPTGRQEAVCTSCGDLERHCDCASPIKRDIARSLEPLVADFHPLLAKRITAVLLEMDNSHLMAVLCAPVVLHNQIHRVLDVLFDGMSEYDMMLLLKADLRYKVANRTTFYPDALTGIIMREEDSDVVGLLHNPAALHDAIDTAVHILRNEFPDLIRNRILV